MTGRIIFLIPRCIIGGAVGFLVFDVPGLLIGAVVGLVAWPVLRAVAWILIPLVGGLSEPEQAAHFRSWRKEKPKPANKDSKPEDHK